MSVKVFQTNSNGKIEFTRAELEKLLNDTYKEGRRDGETKANNSYWTWTAPTLTGTPFHHLWWKFYHSCYSRFRHNYLH